MALTAQVGIGQVGAGQVGNTASGAASPSFSISPNAGHTAGSITINVTYSGGGSAPASGSVPLSIQSGGGSITAGSWIQDSGTTGHFTFVEGAASGTATIFLDSVTSTTKSFSNAAVVPGAPTIGTLTDNHNGTVTITFSAPADNGGATITSYTATSSSGGVNNSGASSPITIAGVSNLVAQTVSVTATNSVGTGAASSASNSVTPDNFNVVSIPNLRLPVMQTDTLGTIAAQTLTLSAATVGTGRTATAGGGTLFATGNSPVGKFILEGGTGLGVALITARTSDTVVTVRIIAAFTGTSLASSGWSIWAPSMQVQTFVAGSLTNYAAVAAGFWLLSPSIRNSWMVDISIPANGAFGDIYAIGRVPDISGGVQAIPINRPATSPPTVIKECKIVPFLESSTIGTPGYQFRAREGVTEGVASDVGSRVTSGFAAVSGGVNLYAVEFSRTPDAQYSDSAALVWDTG